jgi:MFS superfamily sulfate permease-like transporter
VPRRVTGDEERSFLAPSRLRSRALPSFRAELDDLENPMAPASRAAVDNNRWRDGVAFLRRLCPEPVWVGFLTGAGITVAVAAGAEIALNGPWSLAVGAASLALLLFLGCRGLRASAAVLVLALAIAASGAFDLEGRGVRVVGVVSFLSLALSNVLGRLPLATISAILVVVALGWIDARRLSELRQASGRDFRLALVAAFGVTIFGLRWGAAIGVVTALGETLRRAMTARREVGLGGEHRRFEARALPAGDGILVYRWRRRGYRWVRVAWPPRRRAARRSGAVRDEAEGAGNRARPGR